MTRNTLIALKYVDADNYKEFDDVVFEGEMSQETFDLLKSSLDDGQFIIADQIGLPSPNEAMFESQDPGDGDHVWTTVCVFEEEINPAPANFLTNREPTTTMTLEDLTTRLREHVAWDIEGEINRLGLPCDDMKFSFG